MEAPDDQAGPDTPRVDGTGLLVILSILATIALACCGVCCR